LLVLLVVSKLAVLQMYLFFTIMTLQDGILVAKNPNLISYFSLKVGFLIKISPKKSYFNQYQ